VCVCVCVLRCGLCTGSTVAYRGSGRATVACEHSNIMIMILPQNYCAVCRWSSSIGLVTKVQAGWSGAQILIGVRNFFSPTCPDWLWGLPNPLCTGSEVSGVWSWPTLGPTQSHLYWQWSGWGLKLTNSGAHPIPSLLAVKWLGPEADQLWGPPNPLFTGSEVARAWSWPAVGPTQSPLYW